MLPGRQHRADRQPPPPAEVDDRGHHVAVVDPLVEQRADRAGRQVVRRLRQEAGDDRADRVTAVQVPEDVAADTAADRQQQGQRGQHGARRLLLGVGLLGRLPRPVVRCLPRRDGRVDQRRHLQPHLQRRARRERPVLPDERAAVLRPRRHRLDQLVGRQHGLGRVDRGRQHDHRHRLLDRGLPRQVGPDRHPPDLLVRRRLVGVGAERVERVVREDEGARLVRGLREAPGQPQVAPLPGHREAARLAGLARVRNQVVGPGGSAVRELLAQRESGDARGSRQRDRPLALMKRPALEADHHPLVDVERPVRPHHQQRVEPLEDRPPRLRRCSGRRQPGREQDEEGEHGSQPGGPGGRARRRPGAGTAGGLAPTTR